MKLINYADTDWLIGDDAANLLLEYSVLMAREGTADTVDVRVIATEGSEQEVSFLLGPATMMTARAVESETPEPDNTDTIAGIRERMSAIVSPPPVQPSEPGEFLSDYEL